MVNDEPELLDLISDVAALGEDVVWSVDVADGIASPLVNLLLNHEQPIVYLPGLAVNRASAGYRGPGKTDAKDARIIADQARMRRDLHVLTQESESRASCRSRPERSKILEGCRQIARLKQVVRGERSCLRPLDGRRRSSWRDPGASGST
ncbi:IS110 family transposase [Streptomyces flaveolus]|uniref:IS110 family transposase n=1 Tax=Streptomyces flaveolus TaxID=67297 RepID=UPI00378A0297